MLFRFVFFVFISVSINIYSQVYESIENAASKYFITLSNKDSQSNNIFLTLKEILSRNYDKAELESKYQTSLNNFDSLKNHFFEYESELKNISIDSAFVLFNYWYLHFQNVFYDYSKAKFFASPNTKILFFSTSMSCYCTLKMSREQTAELLKFISENDDKYNYWIVDSYWYNELQIEYETLFTPSVVVIDGENNVLHKIIFEEEMLSDLTSYLETLKN